MGIALPIVLLIALGLVAAGALRVRPAGTGKIVLINAFSGPLRDRGYDTLAAVQIAIERSTDARGLREGRRVELVALDDGGTTDGAVQQLESTAADAGVMGVLCCSTPEVSAAASQQVSGPARGATTAFPSAPSQPQAEAAVAALLRALRTDRPAFVRTRGGGSGAFGVAVAGQAHPTAVIDLDLASGGSWERSTGFVLAANPDAVFVDTDVATASLFVRRLRDAGYAGPVAGPESLGCSEMVTWTGSRLGTVFVPVRVQRSADAAYTQRFVAARGHAPCDDDRLFSRATVAMLAGSLATSAASDSSDTWAPATLAPGEFPPRVLSAP